MTKEKKNIGCGVFLIFLGIVLLAERLGWFYVDAQWILPGVIIFIGVIKLIDALR